MLPPRSLRAVMRWTHIGAAGLLGVYLYSPLHADPLWTDLTRLVVVPVLGLSGGWMWQQGYLARLFGRPEP